MNKVTRYPYMISFPDIDESQWTTWFIKSKDDEDELYKVVPEYFGKKPKNLRKYRAKPKDVKMVEDYFKEKKIVDPKANAELFYAHYESVGWFRGKSKIKNWRMCIKNWDFKSSDEKAEQEAQWKMDTSGFFLGYCGKCNSLQSYNKWEIKEDSRCCKAEILKRKKSVELSS